MRKKSFLVVFTAVILVCALPISSSGFSISDSDMQTYRPVDKVSGNSLGEFRAVGVWYQFTGSDYQACGIYDSGNPTYAFVIWVPTQGYFLVSVQSMDMRYQLRGHVNQAGYDYYVYGTLYITKDTNGNYVNSYYQWKGDGGFSLDYDSYYHFQTAFLGNYLVFHRIFTKKVNGTPQRSSTEEYIVPNYQEPDSDIKNKVNDVMHSIAGGSATAEFLDGKSGEGETYPDGTPVPTNANGNNAPTDEFGQTVATLPNGMPFPTYPNGDHAIVYTTPDGETHTQPYTIYDNSSNDADISGEFSKINEMISDLDDLSSRMESNAGDLSVHVDSTRNLIDGIVSWFPAPVIACLVCGAIMIIAVKITGSGKS